MTDYNLKVSELSREIKLWRDFRAVTIQLNLQGSAGATGTEVTDSDGAARSLRGHTELCQGAHQALLRSLAQPPATGGCSTGARCELREGRMDLAVARQSCSSRHHPTCPCFAFGSGSSGQTLASRALAGVVHILIIPVAVCFSRQLPICFIHRYIHLYVCVSVCVC